MKFTLRVFGVVPVVPLAGNICTIATIGITIFYHVSLPMVPFAIKLVQMVQWYKWRTPNTRTSMTLGIPAVNTRMVITLFIA